MARKKAHEDHANHEAWAIPYGDLLTLLLALFVVLYSMSSVNEGKYRVLSDSLNEAFGGRPRSAKPIQVGDYADRSSALIPHIAIMPRPESVAGHTGTQGSSPLRAPGVDVGHIRTPQQTAAARGASGERTSLQHMSDDVRNAMGDLISKNLVVVRQSEFSLEIEIRTDILFPSGVAQISASATPVLQQLADIFRPFPNPIRIEGHTDNVPISTTAFPSNWQLSAARAASVVALFMQNGVDPTRMSVAGFGEYHPAASNDTADGRNRNRRVKIVVLAPRGDVTADLGASVAQSAEDTTAGEPAETVSAEAPAAASSGGDAGTLVSLGHAGQPALQP